MEKILVIEDNAEVRENIAELLHLSNYDVITAENGKVGYEKACAHQPDLILCDIMMPELDGYGVLHLLNNKNKTARIPFVFLTAKAEKNELRKGMLMGADDYITKPYEDEELLKVVELRIKKHRTLASATNDSKLMYDSASAQELLHTLIHDNEVRTIHKREYLYHEHEVPRWLYFVKSGKIKIFKSNDHGKEYIMDIVSEGNFLGFHALMQSGKYTESAAAMVDCEVLLIPKEDFLKLFFENRDVMLEMIHQMGQNIEDREDQLLQVAYNSVRKRVADVLILLYQRFNETGKEELQILREDLAAMSGTAKETVIRTLADFKAEKIIDIESGKIRILKIDRLIHMQD